MMKFIYNHLVNFWWKLKDRKIVTQVGNKPDTYILSAPQKDDFVYIDVFVQGGTAVEHKTQAGITHLLEHYILEQAHSSVTDNITMNGEVSSEQLLIYAKVRRSHAAEIIPLFLQHIVSPSFDDEAILAQEKKAITNEISAATNTLEKKVEKIVFDNRTDGTTGHFRHPSNSVVSISKLSMNDIAQWHKAIFNSSNVKIFFSGYRLNADIYKAAAGAHQSLRMNPGTPMAISRCNYSGKKVIIHSDDSIEGVQLVLSLPWVTLSEDYTTRMSANFLLDAVFSWDKDSLNQAVRNEGIYGFTYDVIKNATSSLLTIRCTAPADAIPNVTRHLSRHLGRHKTEIVPEEYLHTLKEETYQQHITGWRSNRRLDWVTDEIANSIWKGGLDADMESIENVSTETVQEVAVRFFDAEKANLVLYGDTSNCNEAKLLSLINF